MLPEAAPFVAYVTGAHHSARLLQCVNEPELDLSGLGDAIKDFSLNNPAVKAPSRRLKLGFGAVLSASFDPARLPQRPAFVVFG